MVVAGGGWVVVVGGWVVVVVATGARVDVVVVGGGVVVVVGSLAAVGAAASVSIFWVSGESATFVTASFPTEPANTAAATLASSGSSITIGSPVAAGPEGVTNAAKPMIADTATTAIVVAEETERCLETRRRYVPLIFGRLP